MLLNETLQKVTEAFNKEKDGWEESFWQLSLPSEIISVAYAVRLRGPRETEWSESTCEGS